MAIIILLMTIIFILSLSGFFLNPICVIVKRTARGIPHKSDASYISWKPSEANSNGNILRRIVIKMHRAINKILRNTQF